MHLPRCSLHSPRLIMTCGGVCMWWCVSSAPLPSISRRFPPRCPHLSSLSPSVSPSDSDSDRMLICACDPVSGVVTQSTTYPPSDQQGQQGQGRARVRAAEPLAGPAGGSRRGHRHHDRARDNGGSSHYRRQYHHRHMARAPATRPRPTVACRHHGGGSGGGSERQPSSDPPPLPSSFCGQGATCRIEVCGIWHLSHRSVRHLASLSSLFRVRCTFLFPSYLIGGGAKSVGGGW